MKKILWILGQYNSRHVIKHVTLKFSILFNARFLTENLHLAFYPGGSFGLKFNPSHSKIYFQIIWNQFEKRFKSHSIQIAWKSNWLISIQSEISIQMNPRSEWFGIFRKQISERLGIVLIRSDWIPIRNFRQGNIFYSLEVEAQEISTFRRCTTI